jgi:hypothetical protein
MIRKLVVCPGQLEFWHVAGHTLVCGHRTGLRARFPASVTRLAFCVVVDRFVAHLVVRVMAREAANSWVICIVALAARQPVRLEANVTNAQITLQGNFFPRPVTLSTEVRHLLRGHSV